MYRDSNRLEPLIDPAVKTLKDMFSGGGHTADEMQVARIASSVLATWAKLKQSERAQDGLIFAMARELATDPQQLEAYIRTSLPDLPLFKTLDAKRLPAAKEKKG